MTKERAAAGTHTSRVIRAPPEELYAAFLDPTALIEWLPPAEMTGEIHAFDARVGGGYRMSLYNSSRPDLPSASDLTSRTPRVETLGKLAERVFEGTGVTRHLKSGSILTRLLLYCAPGDRSCNRPFDPPVGCFPVTWAGRGPRWGKSDFACY